MPSPFALLTLPKQLRLQVFSHTKPDQSLMKVNKELRGYLQRNRLFPRKILQLRFWIGESVSTSQSLIQLRVMLWPFPVEFIFDNHGISLCKLEATKPIDVKNETLGTIYDVEGFNCSRTIRPKTATKSAHRYPIERDDSDDSESTTKNQIAIVPRRLRPIDQGKYPIAFHSTFFKAIAKIRARYIHIEIGNSSANSITMTREKQNEINEKKAQLEEIYPNYPVEQLKFVFSPFYPMTQLSNLFARSSTKLTCIIDSINSDRETEESLGECIQSIDLNQDCHLFALNAPIDVLIENVSKIPSFIKIVNLSTEFINSPSVFSQIVKKTLEKGSIFVFSSDFNNEEAQDFYKEMKNSISRIGNLLQYERESKVGKKFENFLEKENFEGKLWKYLDSKNSKFIVEKDYFKFNFSASQSRVLMTVLCRHKYFEEELNFACVMKTFANSEVGEFLVE